MQLLSKVIHDRRIQRQCRPMSAMRPMATIQGMSSNWRDVPLASSCGAADSRFIRSPRRRAA